MAAKCLRCKRKKIKCDREEPICHQCITAKVECQYVERRQRPRLAQQKNVMQHLSQRLEELEKHVSGATDDRSPSALLQTPRREAPRRSTPVPSPEASLTVADGQDSWVIPAKTTRRIKFAMVANSDRFIALLQTRVATSRTKRPQSILRHQASTMRCHR